MKDTQKQPENSIFSRLSAPTPATASGGAFSLASVLPTLLLIVVSVALVGIGVLDEAFQETDAWLYITLCITPVAFGVTAFAYLRYRKIPVRVAVCSQACSWRYYVLAVCLQIGLFALAELNGLFLAWLERFGYQPQEIQLPELRGFGIVGVLFVVAVLPAVAEELIFRGILLDGLKKNFPSWAAVLLCGGIFAVYHQRPEQTIYQFCCGAGYALLTLRAGSVLPTVLAHFLNNALIIILHANGITALSIPVFIAVVSVAAVCLTGTLVYLIRVDKTQPQRQSPVDKKGFFVWAALGLVVIVCGWITGLVSGL